MLGRTPASRLLFADVSDYQDRFNALSYRRAGHRFVVVKAGEGGERGRAVGAGQYAARVAAAHASRLKVGHYWFARPFDHPAKTVADLIVAATEAHYRVGDRTIVDLEVGTPTAVIGWTHELATELRARGRKPVGYTDAAYLNEGGQALADCFDAWWIADYDGTIYRLPKLPRCLILAKQYTDGIAGAQPRRFAGIGACDGSAITKAGAQWLGV